MASNDLMMVGRSGSYLEPFPSSREGPSLRPLLWPLEISGPWTVSGLTPLPAPELHQAGVFLRARFCSSYNSSPGA